jgi:RNA polymerase sigma-70 factor (subfamily 1)
MLRVQAGDEDAFQDLFARYENALRGRIRRRVPANLARKVSVADILQETRIVALQRCVGFEDRGPGSVRNWLLTILDLKIRETLRRYAATAKRAARREVTRGRRLETAEYAAVGPSPSQAAIGAEVAELLRKATATLSHDDQEVLRLTLGERLSIREASVRMQRSYEAVKKLYGRAILRLRRAFEELGGETHE